MKSAAGTEVILTIGIIIAVAISLVQLKGVFYGQQQISQEEVVVSFARDLEEIVGKAIGTTGDASFVYYPSIKKYSVDISNNTISIFDKTSGKNASFSKSAPEIVENYFEDSSKIFIISKEGKIIITPRCHENGEQCKNDLICCSGYCNVTSKKCNIPPVCPAQWMKCLGAPQSNVPGGNSWIDINGTTCCPFNDNDDISGPVCSSKHCCPTSKPKWCDKPQTGSPRCVDNTEFINEKCEEICPSTISQCFNKWHWNHYDGTFYMNPPACNPTCYVCDFFETCQSPVVQPIAKEIIECCNNKCAGNCHSLCNKALSDSGLSSTDTPETRKKCYGLYAIYGQGAAARWMQGYMIHWEAPASIMLSGQTWMCTGYSVVTTTLLRSVGYGKDEVYSICGPGHAYNIVKFPGDTKFTIVDTVGNCPGNYKPGGTPPACVGGYPYCSYGGCSPCMMNDEGGTSCPPHSEVYGC